MWRPSRRPARSLAVHSERCQAEPTSERSQIQFSCAHPSKTASVTCRGVADQLGELYRVDEPRGALAHGDQIDVGGQRHRAQQYPEQLSARSCLGSGRDSSRSTRFGARSRGSTDVGCAVVTTSTTWFSAGASVSRTARWSSSSRSPWPVGCIPWHRPIRVPRPAEAGTPRLRR